MRREFLLNFFFFSRCSEVVVSIVGNMAINIEMSVLESEALAQSGFSSEEIVSLLWLRQWYQTVGSDRIMLLRRWEFLKFLVINGKLAL